MDLSHEHHRRRLVIPRLHEFYVAASNFWYPLLRIVAGGMLLAHGIPKVMAGVDRIAAALARYSLHPSVPLAYFVIFLETVGAVCLIFGLFTRFFAAALAIEFAIITFWAHLGRGWSGMELPFLWGVVYFVIALHGGGPYSLDRKIGREL